MGELATEISDLLSDYVPQEENTDNDSTIETDEAEANEEVTDESEDETQNEEDTEETDQEEDAEDEPDEVEDEEEVVSEEAEENSEDDADDGIDTNQALINELNSVAAGNLDLGVDFDDTTEKEVDNERSQQAVDNPEGEIRHEQQQQNLDFDEVVSKPEVFQQAVSNIVSQIVEQKTQEIIQSVTGMVGYQVQQQLSLKSLTDKFWQENDDLAEVKPYVAMVASTIQSKKPDMPISDIFQKTSEIVRAKLKINKTGGDGTSQKKTKKVTRKKPALVKSTRASRSTQTKPKQSKLNKDISDLIDF